ncbi:hypothetical protein CFP56_011694, partial [Quercus suber]
MESSSEEEEELEVEISTFVIGKCYLYTSCAHVFSTPFVRTVDFELMFYFDKSGSDELKKIKEKHVLSLRLLKRTIKALPINYYILEKGQNPGRIPFLKEPTVDEVIDMDIGSSSKDKFPMAIHDDTDEGKNIALLVVDNRQPQIHQLLLKRELLTETMLQKLDKDGNNALHLAAKLWISSSSKEDELKKKETSILAEARNGITEIVEEILKYSMSIHDETDERKNIALLAVENRQPTIYQLLLKRGLLTETMLQKLDKDGNNALHLAAKLGINKPWLIPGAALQMQWEIKCLPRLVAALIATVAFATSTAIPGGIKEGSGSPYLETYPAFDVFDVTSLVALYFSVTALDKLKNKALPVYAVTCLPITLYFDLVRTYFRKVPRSSHK